MDSSTDDVPSGPGKQEGFVFVAGGPASQKLGAAGTRNLEWTLIPRLRPLGPLNVKRRFLMLRTQLEASCATRAEAGCRRHKKLGVDAASKVETVRAIECHPQVSNAAHTARPQF